MLSGDFRVGPPSVRTREDATQGNVIFGKYGVYLSNTRDSGVRGNQELMSEGGDLTLEEMRGILCKERELLRQVRRPFLNYKIKCCGRIVCVCV